MSPAGAGADRSVQRQVLVVEGMFCASCAAAVEAVLARQPGVRAASAHFAADAVAIEWDPAHTTLERLRGAVARLGYATRTLDEPADSATQVRLRLAERLAVAVFSGMWSMFAVVGLYFGSPDAAMRELLAVGSGVFAMPALLWSGWPFYVAGWRTLRARAPGLDSLILLGVAFAVLLSLSSLLAGRSQVYFDTALMLVTFQLIARLVDRRLRSDAARRVRGLLDTGQHQARRIVEGAEEQVPVSAVQRGDRLRIAAGDTLAVDGTVADGMLWVDRSRLTGESDAVDLGVGARLWAGDQAVGGAAQMTADAVVGKRRIDALASHVRRVLTEKPAWQRKVDALARHLLPCAAGAAALGAVLALLAGATPFDAAARALSVFVIGCPCALSLAVPLVASRAAAHAAHRGALLRDTELLQHFRRPDVIFLDKTGTLTQGRPAVVGIHPAPGIEQAELLRWAATASAGSAHPLARALASLHALDAVAQPGRAVDIPGAGLTWTADGEEVRIGRRAWLVAGGVAVPDDAGRHTTSHVARNGRWIGTFEFADPLREHAVASIEALRTLGCELAILSGDRDAVVAGVAGALRLPCASELTPEDKLRRIEEERARGRYVALCGDGINDGPALAAADLGIAVGEASAAAQSAADITLLDGDVKDLPRLFRLLARSSRVIRQNLFFAVAYNAAAVPLAVAGLVHPLVAAVAMSLSSVTVLLNTARLRP
uniref:Copper-translocating P-type ATPase n=1 Tax=Simulacricoccus ruber TaxID=2303410 RepID=A0A3Q8I209_9BACT|nr:copper-translocating P-type ATPase [Simulacricoccus ruber]